MIAGWTPLHLAALISAPPLISFLLTRGASPYALTTRGLTPLDLVSDMTDTEDVALFLQHATSSGSSSATPLLLTLDDQPTLSARRQAMLQRRRMHASQKVERLAEEERKSRLAIDRERWLRERARVVEVDAELLLPPTKTRSTRKSSEPCLGRMGDEDESLQDHHDDGIGDVKDDSMLVFSLSHLPSIFDILITSYRPHCLPIARRTLPANALFLYARFAHYRCDETWLEELVEGAVERIEQGVYVSR